MSDTVWNCKQRLQILGTELGILEIWKRSVSETQKISSGRTHYVYMIIFFSHPCENTLVSTFPHLQNVLMKLQTLNDFPLWHIKISNVTSTSKVPKFRSKSRKGANQNGRPSRSLKSKRTYRRTKNPPKKPQPTRPRPRRGREETPHHE